MTALTPCNLVIPDVSLGYGTREGLLSDAQARDIVNEFAASLPLEGKRVLLIVPDGTRSAPVGLLFRAVHEALGKRVAGLDVMFALGTHPAMSHEAMLHRLELSETEYQSTYAQVGLLNHAWDDPAQLAQIGTLSREEVRDLTDGLFEMEVPVKINRCVFDYDLLLICGPVFPHEVVGFSGGNKYLFPGISGPEILNFFHWLGAVVTNPRIIGHGPTPVRRVVDRVAQMVPTPRAALCMTVKGHDLAGLWAGTPEAAWRAAAQLSEALHVVYKPHPFQTVVSCAPLMYDDLWTGGKCMYKLEPVVADGGELIIYAPHITEVSVTHGQLIERIGYHVRDYFLKQWNAFKDVPWGVLAHSTHVRGIGTYENGVEHGRIKVTLATGISPQTCARINLGYRDPATLNIEAYANREDEGVLLVRQAGEVLYRLKDAPAWAASQDNLATS